MSAIRSSDVFLKEDIRAMLKALLLTIEALPEGEYKDGYLRAIAAVALAFNLGPDGYRLGDECGSTGLVYNATYRKM